jgi:hypothetical protein
MKMRTIIRLPNSTFFDIEMVNKNSPDKAKPSARRGRKAAGAEQFSSMAELPKDELQVGRLFCLL